MRSVPEQRSDGSWKWGLLGLLGLGGLAGLRRRGEDHVTTREREPFTRPTPTTP